MCFVAYDYDAEMKAANDHAEIKKAYKLPNATYIELTTERIQGPELLFQPVHANKKGSGEDGIHKSTFDSIMKCDNDIKKELFQNIVLAGGSSMFEGMEARMKKELLALAPSPMGPSVKAPADRKYSCWLGGAILSLIDKFDPMWITKAQYDDVGAGIVHRQCF